MLNHPLKNCTKPCCSLSFQKNFTECIYAGVVRGCFLPASSRYSYWNMIPLSIISPPASDRTSTGLTGKERPEMYSRGSLREGGQSWVDISLTMKKKQIVILWELSDHIQERVRVEKSKNSILPVFKQVTQLFPSQTACSYPTLLKGSTIYQILFFHKQLCWTAFHYVPSLLQPLFISKSFKISAIYSYKCLK